MSRFFKSVLLTGLFVGTTDLISAYITQYIITGKFAGKMFQYIAAGALGLKTAMKGGFGIALLGVFFHYFIAFSFTLLFYLIFPRVKFLSFNKYLVGVLYAIFVNLFMSFVVLPLTLLPVRPFVLVNAIIDWIVFSVVFGIPIVYNTYKYYGKDARAQV